MASLFIIFILTNVAKFTLSTIPIYNCYGLITNNKNYNGLVNFFKILINFLRAILKELII